MYIQQWYIHQDMKFHIPFNAYCYMNNLHSNVRREVGDIIPGMAVQTLLQPFLVQVMS